MGAEISRCAAGFPVSVTAVIEKEHPTIAGFLRFMLGLIYSSRKQPLSNIGRF
jgi:hypothetical protein